MISEERELVIYLDSHRMIALLGTLAEEPSILSYVIREQPDGFKNGMVSNLDRAAQSLESITDTLLAQHGPQAARNFDYSAYVVLANAKLKMFTFSSSIYFQGVRRTLTARDVRSVIQQTRAVATLPLSECILQSVPVSFVVNDHEDIVDPIGLEAHRIGVKLKIFTLPYDDFKNISKAFESSEIEIKGFFPRTLASSAAVLSPQERQDGVLLIDVGTDSSSLTLWKKDELIDAKVIEGGDDDLNLRIGNDLEIDPRDASRVKTRYGSLAANTEFGEELIPLIVRDGKESRQIQRQVFQKKFFDHVKQWMELIIKEAHQFSQSHKIYSPAVVATGENVNFDGFVEFLRSQFLIEARIGYARKVDAPNELLVDPSLVAGVGIYKWLGFEMSQNSHLYQPRGFMQKTFSTARDWFGEYF